MKAKKFLSENELKVELKKGLREMSEDAMRFYTALLGLEIKDFQKNENYIYFELHRRNFFLCDIHIELHSKMVSINNEYIQTEDETPFGFCFGTNKIKDIVIMLISTLGKYYNLSINIDGTYMQETFMMDDDLNKIKSELEPYIEIANDNQQ